MMHAELAPAGQLVTILAIYRHECIARLEKLAKRAARYGQTISWTATPRTEETLHKTPWGKEVRRVVEVVDLVLHGSAPRCGDYVFEGSLERVDGGVIISSPTGVNVGKLGREWDGRCDHCGSNRARTHGFVVRKGRTRKVVGKSCLRDHLGMDSPTGLAAMFTHLRELQDTSEDGWGGYGGRWEELTEGVIATSRAAIAIWGWRPSSYDGFNTMSFVNLLYSRPSYVRGREVNGRERAMLREELEKNGPEYERQAREVIEWARNLKPRNDYLNNLRVAISSETVDSKRFGLVVSAAAAFDKQQEVESARKAKEAEEASRPASEFFGTAGERVTGKVLELRSRFALPDYGFGTQVLFKFADENGCIFTWKTGSQPRVDNKALDVGSKYRADLTIKGHREWKETKETQVIRVKLAKA